MTSKSRFYPAELSTYKTLSIIFLLLFISFSACKKDDDDTPTPPNDPPSVTSSEFINDLLFVNKADFQIVTSEPATFSSPDPRIQITAEGLIQRITSAEVVPIDITDLEGATTRIYAVGATDDTFDNPYAAYHGVHATDPFEAYKKGWETLNKIATSSGNYAIILRHADATEGKDFSITTGPANWWKSCDPALARQLNQQGNERSTELGRIFKDLNYPIARVYSSEFCRSISTAEHINAGPQIVIDGKLNHYSHNVSGYTQISGILLLLQSVPLDEKMTLFVTHHPANEVTYPTFPRVSPFTWTGAYFVGINAAKTITYEGAVSWGMFKYWRDKKLNLL